MRIDGRLLAIATVLATALAIATPAAGQQAVMKIGTATVGDGDQNTWMARFKERVEARAPGRISIQLFPGSQVGDNTRMVEGIQLGTLEGYVGPTTVSAIAERRLQIFDAPGVFDDMQHGQRVITDPAFRSWFLALGERRNFTGISMWVSGTACMITKTRPIRTVEDFRGLKMSVLATRMETETMSRLGAAGVPMPMVDRLHAMQTGQIDGTKLALVVADAFKFWTMGKYLTESDEVLIIPLVIVHKPWFDKLPADLQAIMREEGRKLDDELIGYSTEKRKLYRENWVKNGGELIQLSDAERKRFLDRLAGVADAVLAENPEVKAAFDHMMPFVEKHRKK
ncbi:MAG: TRAP transporter substrate-binding protein [Alphaproteobacteria bacterium]|nr:TRAP transporter substrate-binding protein [Alphaproteobacteria bacterium]